MTRALNHPSQHPVSLSSANLKSYYSVLVTVGNKLGLIFRSEQNSEGGDRGAPVHSEGDRSEVLDELREVEAEVSREVELLAEISRLRQEIEQLKRVNQDLSILLTTTVEHGDLVEAQLYQTNQQMMIEIEERKRIQSNLKALLEVITKRKEDLEIVVHTIMEHGDVMDIQWSQKLSEINKLASLDGLTQIANRRRFDEHLEYQWKQMVRDRMPLSLILCDIDHFKQYNDSYGHLSGDDCLQKVANVLSNCVNRPSDLVSRFGGEEFAAILPQTDLEGALCVAQRMHQEIGRLQIPHNASPVSPHITLSIGVSCLVPNLEMASEDLIHLADRHLYLAKHQGRNQIIFTSASCEEV